MELAAYFLPNIQFSSSSLCKLGPNPVFMRWGINPIEASVCWPLDPGAQSARSPGLNAPFVSARDAPCQRAGLFRSLRIKYSITF